MHPFTTLKRYTTGMTRNLANNGIAPSAVYSSAQFPEARFQIDYLRWTGVSLLDYLRRYCIEVYGMRYVKVTLTTDAAISWIFLLMLVKGAYIELTDIPWCRIYASVNWVSIGSDIDLSPVRHKATTWTNVELLRI